MKQPLKICIVGLKCFDHIAGHPVPRYLGGIETQLVVLAKGLVQAGCEVSLITYDHGQKDRLQFSGVKVFKSYPPDGGAPGWRWWRRSRQLWEVMRQVDAEVYLQMGAGSETGQVAMGCQDFAKLRKRFVFCLASDANYGPHLRMGRFGWEGLIYRYGLRMADLIVAQTNRQKQGLHQVTGLSSQIIPMAVASAERGEMAEGPLHPPSVLWVGRVTPQKRLEWLIDVAQRCPQVNFDIVGTPNKTSDYATGLLEAAARLPNMKAHGRLPDYELQQMYQRAKVLCCTSTLEGFPTTFLEAWSRSIPVVTTFDPDGLVRQHNLGRVAETLEEFVSHLTDVLNDAAAYAAVAESARRYYQENHTVEVMSQRFRSVLEQMVAKPR